MLFTSRSVIFTGALKSPFYRGCQVCHNSLCLGYHKGYLVPPDAHNIFAFPDKHQNGIK